MLVTVGRRVMSADAKSAATANARWLSSLARLAEVVTSAPDVHVTRCQHANQGKVHAPHPRRSSESPPALPRHMLETE